MRQVLIIGRNSYIGCSFQNHLDSYAKGETKAKCIGASDGAWKNVDFHRYDTILHVAALVHKKEEPKWKAEYDKINTEFPLTVAKKAKESGVKQFVFLSTMAVYGNDSDLITKETIEKPVTYYGKSKLEAERKLKQLADHSFQVIILRPPMVYGRGCPGNYGRLEKLAAHFPVFPKVSNQRSMIYIENLCECIRQAMQNTGAAFQTICPQNAAYVNTTDLVCTIRRSMGKRTCVLPLFQSMIAALAKRNTTFGKVFGNCCYENDPAVSRYQIMDFEDSVRNTVKG